jgi:MFS family permease
VWKTLGAHILIPLFLGAGMALAYLGSFHEPAPHNLQVAVVGDTPASMVFAQAMNDKGTGKVDVRTVSSEAKAEQLVKDRDIAAAYETSKSGAKSIGSTAASATTAEAAQKIFMPIAYQQHLPVAIDDVQPVSEHDSTGQGLFFMMVALTVGSYACAAAVSAVAGRMRPIWRIATTAVVTAAVTAIVTVVAGPIYHVVAHGIWSLAFLSWLYTFGITMIGVGLHPILGRWTTAIVTMLFVMLNFTSCGGIFASAFMPSFFSGLHAFWNGAAFIDASQALVYFPGQTWGMDGLKLAIWAGVGILLVVVTHTWSEHKRRLADENLPVTSDERLVVA